MNTENKINENEIMLSGEVFNKGFLADVLMVDIEELDKHADNLENWIQDVMNENFRHWSWVTDFTAFTDDGRIMVKIKDTGNTDDDIEVITCGEFFKRVKAKKGE